MKDKKRIILGTIVILIISALIYGYFRYSKLYPSTDNAYVSANLVNVAPKVNGYIEKVLVKNNQYVNKGDLLFTINPVDYDLTFDQTQKNYDSQSANVAMAENQLAIQRNEITKNKSQYDFLDKRLKRYTTLYQANSISKQEYQAAVNDFNNIRAQRDIDQERYKQFTHMLEYNKTKQDAAKLQLDTAKSTVGYTKYFSPSTGYVTNMATLSPGEFVNASQQLFGLVDTNSWSVDANFKETQLSRIKVGQRATITLDMYDTTFTGHVQSISFASGNTFSLIPAQNATGNWVKVTQRFTVRIKIDNKANYPLRVGASAHVTINT